MKLLIATGLYPPEIGGPATYTKLLEEKLPARGYEVSVLPFSTSRHLPKVLRHLHFFFVLLRKAWSVDVVYAQDTVSVGLPALLAAKLLRKPFIVRVPGDYAWEQSVQRFGVTDTIDEFQLHKQPWRVRLLQSIQQLVTTRSTLTITPSKYFQSLVAGWGVSPEKNITIYNGVDLNITPDKVDKSAGKTIVTAGRLVQWKGIGGLITMLTDLSDWNLVVIGDGPLRAELEQLAATAGVSDRVRFVGSIPRTEVFGWCVAADAFVLNTQFESFSYQVVEAMHSGTPTIVTSVGSLPELITTGVNGVLVEPNDFAAIKMHLHETVSSPEVWKNRTQNAKVKVQQFTIESCMQHLDEHLKKLT
jgi:glycosyltransferase involved in cell wall biosynthesis